MNITKEYIDDIIFKAAIRGVFKVKDDGGIVMALAENCNTPWYIVKEVDTDNECTYWDNFLKTDGMGKGQSFIPLRCLNCWKVVVRPQTFKQLMQLLKIQLELKRPSKCGIERRESVNGLYGGYFYNHTFEEGMECLQIVKEMVNQDIGDIDVFLKRGCTEFEINSIHGDPETWQPFKGQEEIEAYIRQQLGVEFWTKNQTDFIKKQVMGKWIRWAYAAGDNTYLEYTGGYPVYPAYRRY